MMNKELCQLFGVDPFVEWVIDEIDYLDDEMRRETSSVRYIELMAKKEILLKVRDKFAELHPKKEAVGRKDKIIINE